jgi:hypothetical protein
MGKVVFRARYYLCNVTIYALQSTAFPIKRGGSNFGGLLHN